MTTTDDVLAFIQRYTAEKGFSPTTREIREALGIGSSTLQRRLDELERDGLIGRSRGTHRSILVVGRG